MKKQYKYIYKQQEENKFVHNLWNNKVWNLRTINLKNNSIIKYILLWQESFFFGNANNFIIKFLKDEKFEDIYGTINNLSFCNCQLIQLKLIENDNIKRFLLIFYNNELINFDTFFNIVHQDFLLYYLNKLSYNEKESILESFDYMLWKLYTLFLKSFNYNSDYNYLQNLINTKIFDYLITDFNNCLFKKITKNKTLRVLIYSIFDIKYEKIDKQQINFDNFTVNINNLLNFGKKKILTTYCLLNNLLVKLNDNFFIYNVTKELKFIILNLSITSKSITTNYNNVENHLLNARKIRSLRKYYIKRWLEEFFRKRKKQRLNSTILYEKKNMFLFEKLIWVTYYPMFNEEEDKLYRRIIKIFYLKLQYKIGGLMQQHYNNIYNN